MQERILARLAGGEAVAPEIVDRYEAVVREMAQHRGVFNEEAAKNEEGRRLTAELWAEMLPLRSKVRPSLSPSPIQD